MRIEDRTKRVYAGLLVLGIVMVLNFTLFIGPHPCSGVNVDCSRITWPNGTITDVPPGQVATQSKDIRPVLFIDIAAGIPVFGLLAWSILRQALTAKQAFNDEKPSSESDVGTA